MRNITAIQRRDHLLGSTVAPDVPVTATAWDPSTDELICAFGPVDSSVELVRITKDGRKTAFAFWDVQAESSPAGENKILDMHYFDDTASICTIFSSGDIVVVPEDTPDQVEIVGTVDEGITAAAWSPDGDALALSTAASTLLLMTRNFEPISDVPLSANDLNASQHVSVGWGKAETQFKGKHARSMRDPTMPEKVDTGVLSEKDDNIARITWRGDGAYLALSTVETVEAGRRRVIRVYSREGTLDSVSEPVDGLEGPLSWRPAGNLIAGIQRFADKLDVVFFERNGLRHGEFTVTAENASANTIRSLSWNGDSTLLAITLADRVQLWSMGNYHWYLKQELSSSGAGQSHVPAVCWHAEKPLKLASTANALVTTREFAWTTAAGSCMPPHDYGIVAVVDGTSLHLNPLRIANIPPPMAFRQVTLESIPIDVAISSHGTKIAILRDSAVDLIYWSLGMKSLVSEPELVPRLITFPANEGYRQITFVGEDTFGLLQDLPGEKTSIRVINLDSTGRAVATDRTFDFEFSISTLGALENPHSFTYTDQSGEVSRFDLTDETEVSVAKLPARCPRFEVRTVGEEPLAFGLSQNGRLFVNDTVISSSCTSFAVTDVHLIYTTSQHFLKFVHLSPHPHELDVPPDDPTGDERCRNVERGSRLVQVMPSKFSLVLQMPRGNLETIFPRALVLAGVRRSIESKDYKTAFLACRSHRVDLNILHDHAPAQFLSSIDVFVQQLKKVEHVDLFLSQLRDEDVSQTMYRETLPQAQKSDEAGAKPALTSTGTSKVNKICSAFIDYFLQTKSPSRLQNIITAYVSKSPPDLEAALFLIAGLGASEAQDQCITHICFLSDVNKLYDTALGIYDMPLALLIAQQSQKDPREYLPFLQGLQELEENRRKFTIDNHLGRFAKALRHLHALGSGAFEEARDYTVAKELYSVALDVYKYEDEQLKEIMKLYAEYLSQNSRPREAGLAYEFLGDYDTAAEQYSRAGLWQESLFAAQHPTAAPGLLDRLSASLTEGLSEAHDHAAAARIHLDYRHDAAEAVRSLCAGSHFAEAMRVAALSSKAELLESAVDPALLEAFAGTTEFVADCKGQLAAQVGRLRELKQKAAEDPLHYYDGVTEADAPDDISLAPTAASTSASLFTRYTGATGKSGTAATGDTRRTGKNRRREERKRARGRKGSVYEAEYLVASVRRLAVRVEGRKEEVRRLVEGLVRRRMRAQAGAVQGLMVELVERVREGVEEVWGEMGAGEVEGRELEGETGKVEGRPVVGAFEPLPLV